MTSQRSPFIDWSMVTDPCVDDALQSLLTEQRMNERWLNLSSSARSVHDKILRGYVRSARPPTANELLDEGVSHQQIDAVLEDLELRDLIVYRNGVIQSAYPFSTDRTWHSVEVDGIFNWTVCFIDALGTAAMIGAAATARSNCPVCQERIQIHVNDDGLTTHRIDPSGTNIWAGVLETGGCAADTQCQTMLAFCSEAHLEEWKADGAVGFQLTPVQAIQTGAAIFRPFL